MTQTQSRWHVSAKPKRLPTLKENAELQFVAFGELPLGRKQSFTNSIDAFLRLRLRGVLQQRLTANRAAGGI